MSNLVAALKEINRHPVGIDGIHFGAYAHPRDYVLRNPSLLDVDAELNPLKAVQESLVYGALPDATVASRIKNRTLERGTVENRVRERAFLRKLNANLDGGFNDGSWGYRPRRSPEIAILRVR